MRTPKTHEDSRGQALIETALVMPLLLLVILNAVNFGYVLLVALNLSAAPRSGVLYSIVGFSTPGTLNLPAAGPPGTNTSVSYLTYQDMTGALGGAAGATVQVCSTSLGVAAPGTSNCVTCSAGSCNAGSTVSTPAADPEPTAFYLQSVDVKYSFSPIIPGQPFGGLLPSACSGSGPVTCTFTRHTSMRSMN